MSGSTGVLPPPKGYLKRLREICDQHGILLIADEVQTGAGRTPTGFSEQVNAKARVHLLAWRPDSPRRGDADEQPTASVVAAADPQLAADVARAVAVPYFRPYTNTDAVGTEIAGLTKNVIALSVGICDGRHYGDNSKASVITRGLAESTRLALALGARSETMAGLAGIGDLVATCSSPLSRNRTAGRLLGQGRTLEQIDREMTQTAEGLKSAPAVLQLARAHGVDMPITEAVVAILDGRITVEHLAPLLATMQKVAREVPNAEVW